MSGGPQWAGRSFTLGSTSWAIVGGGEGVTIFYTHFQKLNMF